MLLSWPTWLIHLLTVTEWGTAMWLFWRQGQLLGRRELRVFALCMTPHLFAGLSILLFHASTDTQRWLIELSRTLSFSGSLLLLSATLAMVLAARRQRPIWAWALVALGVVWAVTQWPLLGEQSREMLQAANLCYLAFLLTLLWLHRLERTLFSPLTITGFWFLLVFVAATIASTQIATVEQGLPSLSHHDLLHGLSESLLSVSNLLIAIGVYRQLRRLHTA